MSRCPRNQKGQGLVTWLTMRAMHRNSPQTRMWLMHTADTPQQTFTHQDTETLLHAGTTFRWTHITMAWTSIHISEWKHKITETGTKPGHLWGTPTWPLIDTETQTLPSPAHRNTEKRGNTATQLMQTNTNTRNANTPETLASKATVSLTWWRKGTTRIQRVKTVGGRTRGNQTIMSWQSSSKNLVQFLQSDIRYLGYLQKASALTVVFFGRVRDPQCDAAWHHYGVLQSRLCPGGGRSQQGGQRCPEGPEGFPSAVQAAFQQTSSPSCQVQHRLSDTASIASFTTNIWVSLFSLWWCWQEAVWTKEEFSPGCTICSLCPYSRQMQSKSNYLWEYVSRAAVVVFWIFEGVLCKAVCASL